MFDFSIKHLKLFITTLHVCVLYLCDTSMYIYTIYILTYTKICNQDLMEMYKSFNHQNITSMIKEKFNFIMFNMKLFGKFKLLTYFFFFKI